MKNTTINILDITNNNLGRPYKCVRYYKIIESWNYYKKYNITSVFSAN